VFCCFALQLYLVNINYKIYFLTLISADILLFKSSLKPSVVFMHKNKEVLLVNSRLMLIRLTGDFAHLALHYNHVSLFSGFSFVYTYMRANSKSQTMK